ncbi:MAG: response regulator [Bryobacterales bacterium]|nr:response regulator [Bryobacteraceae bacterium]MDW8129909.1 response regulator [Bryobacterales bacterium]
MRSTPLPVPAQILLVDDNELGLAARKALLEEQGYAVTIASSGEAALELFRSQAFDLVITDFRMPGMNGIELIRQLRCQKRDVPIILLSGFVQPLGLNEQVTGADVVLAKSASEVAQLLRTVAKLLRRSRRKPARAQGAFSRARRSHASSA